MFAIFCEEWYVSHSRWKENVVFFGKLLSIISQQVVTFSCGRLTLGIWYTALGKVSAKGTYVFKTLSTRKVHVWVHVRVWLASSCVMLL